MLKYVSLLLVAAVLVGCAGTNQTRATTSLAVSCSTYAAALRSLTAVKPTLTPETIKKVDSVNKGVGVVCAKDSVFDPAMGVAAVEQAIAAINGIKGGS